MNMRIKYLLSLYIITFFYNTAYAQKDSVHATHILVFPVIARSIETSWSFGVAASSTFRFSKTDTVSRTSNLQSVILYSLKKQFVSAVNGAQYFDKEKYILNEQFSYSSYPDKFWGLGKHSPDSAMENYTFKQYYIYLHLLRKISHRIYAGMLFEYQNVMDVDYVPGGLFDKENIKGRYPYKVSGLGLSFTFDNRNNAFAPDKGYFAQIYFDHFDKTFGSTFNYTNIVVDLRKFVRIYKKQVLALQAYSFTNIGDEVPLRSLASFGGSNSMRGYYSGRYRDKRQLVFQTEYRVPLINRIGAAFFCSGGDVGNSFTDYSLTDLKYAVGAGLRFALNKSEKLNLRLDYGIGQGNKNSGLYFQLGEAF